MRDRTQSAEEASNAVAIYDRVTQAWQLLLGEDLHFGYFESPNTDLANATIALTRRLADLARLRRGTRVLDVGCGIGGPALFIAQDTGCDVTGISTSQVGVETASARTDCLRLSQRARFLVRDGMANGFPAECFDCVWIMESSHLMEKKELLLSESARVLRTGGLLVLCDIMVRTKIPFQYLVRNLSEFENLNAVFGKQHVESLDTYHRLTEASGLTVLETEDISVAALPTLEAWRSNAELHREKVRDLVGDEYLERFVRACEFLQHLWAEQKLGYGMLLAGKEA